MFHSVITVAGAICKMILEKYLFLRVCVSLKQVRVAVQDLDIPEHLLLYLFSLFSASH